jgi:hypothetical protein
MDEARVIEVHIHTLESSGPIGGMGEAAASPSLPR